MIDITYGIYLMILLIGDKFFPHELIWKPSSICFFVNILFLNFTISSYDFLQYLTEENNNNNNNNNLFFSYTNNIRYYNHCDATHLNIKRWKIDKAMPVCR